FLALPTSPPRSTPFPYTTLFRSDDLSRLRSSNRNPQQRAARLDLVHFNERRARGGEIRQRNWKRLRNREREHRNEWRRDWRRIWGREKHRRRPRERKRLLEELHAPSDEHD